MKYLENNSKIAQEKTAMSTFLTVGEPSASFGLRIFSHFGLRELSRHSRLSTRHVT